MILELGQIESFPAQIVVESAEEGIPTDYEGVKKIFSAQASLGVQKGNEEFFCQGDVSARLELECARCLVPFETKAEGKIDFILCDEDRMKAIASEGNDSEDYVILRTSDMTADISTIVLQAALLSVSMKPVCSDDCRGLCSQCGANLNTKACKCKAEKSDPRWDGLKRLSINKH